MNRRDRDALRAAMDAQRDRTPPEQVGTVRAEIGLGPVFAMLDSLDLLDPQADADELSANGHIGHMFDLCHNAEIGLEMDARRVARAARTALLAAYAVGLRHGAEAGSDGGKVTLS